MSDIDKLMAVMESAFDPYWREAWTRRQVEDSLSLSSGFMLLADQNGEAPSEAADAAGFVLARKVLDEVELLLIGVSPDMRGRGIGRMLIDRFFEASRKAGAARVFLEMRANNEAERVYLAAGFEPIGRRRDYYRTLDGTSIDAVTFAKSL